MTDDPELNGEDDALQSIIGQQLRQMYDSVLSEPIPDKIVELLARLDDIALPEPSDEEGSDPR
ncbi:MAG: NepR family anti-sigma factor [Pseudomonadota bacterium]